MSSFLFVCKSFPLVLHSVRFSLPLLAYDLGNLWVGKSRMMGYDGLLMVLPIKDERISWTWNLWFRLAKTDMP